MAEDVLLTLTGGWTDARFERDAYGPDEVEGVRATFEREAAVVEVLPVEYRRESGVENVHALTEEWRGERNDPSVPLTDVPPTTAFATRLTYTPYDRERQEVVCLAADADDALAVSLWLAGAAEDAQDLRRHVNRHAGMGSPTGAALSDDDVLEAIYADEPESCVYRAVEADDHRIELPYRYAPVLSAARRTRVGVPRFPSTVRALVGTVSDEAWAERDLADVDFDAPIRRDGAGEYYLDEAVADAVAGTDAESYALVRLGEEP